ncbi:MAG: rhodanese-like domain-containing protein [Gammaproteobacteria bacterium]|nr:rhodanese-like domain-containing protein [Gammaproteobacteria bacterium]MDE0094476.1 rhodanese-like domain-containing protein [Gammaproteobacteria bacterium]MDE0251533.1 rhodanese-like domain-containing protein [Gammaproteobacteria bacterium]MDE0403457.1 rhodanese-like domain-containing protein [Gammaproteobacteria bacterium]
MLDGLFTYVGNHPILVSIFFLLLILFIWNESKRSGKTIDSQQLVQLMNRENAVVLDVRDSTEYSQGHIPHALNIPYTALATRVRELDEYKETPVVVTCKMGQHSSAATNILKKSGFTNVAKLRGGLMEWRGQNMPVTSKS